jgi:hypothetical protein
MIKRILAHLAAQRAHQAAMRCVWIGQRDARANNRRAWVEQYRVGL